MRKASTYQPIRVLSYTIDYHFTKLNPVGYHITNIVFYVLTCIMSFFMRLELVGFFRPGKTAGSNSRIALFASMLFAVHPVHVEAVTWLSARREVLLRFFFFVSLHCYFKASHHAPRMPKAAYYTLPFLFFLLAALSKPLVEVLPGIALLSELSTGRLYVARLHKRAPWFVPALLVPLFVIYILVKVMAEAGGIYPYRGGSFFSNFLMAFCLLIMNIGLIAWTVNYSPICILVMPETVFEFQTLVYVILNVGLVALAISIHKKNKMNSFAILWFYIALFPFSNVIPISTPLTDRYVFIASFAYCLVLTMGFERLWSIRWKWISRDFFPFVSIAELIFLLADYSHMTVRQNRSWKDSVTLWSDALAKNPKNPVAMNGLAVIYLDNGMAKEEAELLKKTVGISPQDPTLHNNLGVAYERLGEYEKSESQYLRALDLKPNYYDARVNLGLLAARDGDFGKSIDILASVLDKNPRASLLHFQKADVYKQAGTLEEAIGEYQKLIELKASVITPYERLGRLYVES